MVVFGESVTVKNYKDTNGNRFNLVVRSNVFPVCLYLNAYLNGNHRSPYSTKKYKFSSESPSFTTLKKYAYELKFLYCHFTNKGISLPHRVNCGEFLSRSEIDDFIRVSKLYSNTKSIDYNNIVSISDKRIRDAIYATSTSQPQVSHHTFRQRVTRLKAYIEYLYVCYHYDRPLTDKKSCIDEKFRKFNIYINNFIKGSRRDNVYVKDSFESVIPSENFFHLLDIIKESSSENPFKSSKLRNKIIMQILINTGVRIGAVLKLKISDLIYDWANPRFLLTRTPNDPTDPRKDRPSNKTKALSVSIPLELMNLIKLYIQTVRINHPKSSEHDFILISEKGDTSGQPLTYNSIHKIVGKFGKSIGIKLHSHKLRHKWNEIFEDKAKQKGYSPEKIEDLRNYAMGWVENSKMASVYNEYQLALTVTEISLQNQRKSVPNLRGIHES